MQQGQQLRQQHLYYQLFQTGILCEFCRQSQEILQCDILMSQIKCPKHICLNCFKIKKNDPCQCGTKYQDHYIREGAVRPAFKYGYRQQADKVFYFPREQKIRKKTQYQNQNTDLISLLAYLHVNPPHQYQSQNVQKRISYYELESKIKRKLKDKKRQEEAVQFKRTVKKKAQFLGRDQGPRQETGLQSCGYQRTYNKGLSLIWNSFFPPDPKMIEFPVGRPQQLNKKPISEQSSFKQFQLERREEDNVHKLKAPSINV